MRRRAEAVSWAGIALSFVVAVHASAGAQAPADAVRFAVGSEALAIPFDLYNGLIVVRVIVNGSAPLSFILDTGASHTTLSVRRARALGLSRIIALSAGPWWSYAAIRARYPSTRATDVVRPAAMSACS